MIAGRGTPDQRPARVFAYRWESEFKELIDLLTQASIDYLDAQIQAGVEAVQIFDSWAGILPEKEFEKWSLAPIIRICREIRQKHPQVRIIVFPRGASSLAAGFAAESAIDAIGLDTASDLEWSAEAIQKTKATQGNLDPLALLAGGEALEKQVLHILERLGSGRHIFNLGHGILPDTPVEHVEHLLQLVRGWNA